MGLVAAWHVRSRRIMLRRCWLTFILNKHLLGIFFIQSTVLASWNAKMNVILSLFSELGAVEARYPEQSFQPNVRTVMEMYV